MGARRRACPWPRHAAKLAGPCSGLRRGEAVALLGSCGSATCARLARPGSRHAQRSRRSQTKPNPPRGRGQVIPAKGWLPARCARCFDDPEPRSRVREHPAVCSGDVKRSESGDAAYASLLYRWGATKLASVRVNAVKRSFKAL